MKPNFGSKSQNLQKWKSECWKRYPTRFYINFSSPQPGLKQARNTFVPVVNSKHSSLRRNKAFKKNHFQDSFTASARSRESRLHQGEKPFCKKKTAMPRSCSRWPLPICFSETCRKDSSTQLCCSVETTLPGKRLPVWPVFSLPSSFRTQVRANPRS